MKTIHTLLALIIVIPAYSGNCSAETAGEQLEQIIATADASGVVEGTDGWLFLKEELEHLTADSYYGEGVISASKTAKKELADPLPAIVDFHAQLQEKGIELIFVPIPPKALLYPDKLPVGLTAEMVAELIVPYQKFYEELSKSGVSVLDLIPVFQAAGEEKQLYCKTDSHFSGTGIALVADELSKRIKKSPWYDAVDKKQYRVVTRDISIHGDLSVMQKKETREMIPLSFVTDTISGKAPVPSVDSPLLLLGDSHTLVFSVGGDLHTTGAGLFDRLSAELGFDMDLLGVRGAGATPGRIKLYQRSRKDDTFLARKKTIVWCLSTREFTGIGGWRKIPVAKK